MSDTVITCPSCGATNTVSDYEDANVIPCPACATPCPKPGPVEAPTRSRMKLRDTMVDEPAPTTVTSVMVQDKPKRKSFFERTKPPENMTEAASSYQFSDERRSTTGRALVWSASCSLGIVAIQYLFSGSTETLGNMATGYVYAIPIFALGLLWAALGGDGLQRVIVLLVMPALWGTLHASAKPSAYVDYIYVFTGLAYLIFIFDFLLRGMKELVFQVFALTYIATFVTQLYFLAGNKDFMSNLGKFPWLQKIMEPTLQTLHLVEHMIH